MKIKNTVNILAVILALQIGLVIASQGGNSQLSPASGDQKLLELSLDEISSLKISDDKKAEVELKKEAGKWIVPAKFNFPADDVRLKAIIGDLLNLKRGYPVAESEQSAKRFKVVEESFERKLELNAGTKKTEVFFGTSPAFKTIHTRLRDGATYLVEFSAFNLVTDPKEWLNFSYLNIPEQDLKKLAIADVLIENEKEIKRVSQTIAL